MVLKNKKTIIHFITSLGEGGAENTLYQLIKFTKKNCIHIVINLSKKNKNSYLISKLGINVINLDIGTNTVLKIKQIINLFKNLDKQNTIVQTWLYHSDFIGGIIARLFKIKKIYWNIRTSEYKFFKFRTKIIIYINAILSYFIPTKIISCSRAGIESHSRIYNSKKFFLIHNGYKKSKCINAKKKFNSIKNFKKKFINVAYIARYDEVKNHIFLIKNLSFLKSKFSFKLILAGKNINKNNIKLNNILKKYKIFNSTILLGSLKKPQELFKFIDIFILPSKTEGFPNILAEAMLNKTVCLANNVGDVKRILNNKFIYNNSEEFKKKLIYLVNVMKSNNKKWKTYKISNKSQIIKKFNINKMINKYKKIWSI